MLTGGHNGKPRAFVRSFSYEDYGFNGTSFITTFINAKLLKLQVPMVKG